MPHSSYFPDPARRRRSRLRHGSRHGTGLALPSSQAGATCAMWTCRRCRPGNDSASSAACSACAGAAVKPLHQAIAEAQAQSIRVVVAATKGNKLPPRGCRASLVRRCTRSSRQGARRAALDQYAAAAGASVAHLAGARMALDWRVLAAFRIKRPELAQRPARGSPSAFSPIGQRRFLFRIGVIGLQLESGFPGSTA